MAAPSPSGFAQGSGSQAGAANAAAAMRAPPAFTARAAQSTGRWSPQQGGAGRPAAAYTGGEAQDGSQDGNKQALTLGSARRSLDGGFSDAATTVARERNMDTPQTDASRGVARSKDQAPGASGHRNKPSITELFMVDSIPHAIGDPCTLR